jgi:hypothetical protein
MFLNRQLPDGKFPRKPGSDEGLKMSLESIIKQIDEQSRKLMLVRAALLGTKVTTLGLEIKPYEKPTISASARKKMADAQKKCMGSFSRSQEEVVVGGGVAA